MKTILYNFFHNFFHNFNFNRTKTNIYWLFRDIPKSLIIMLRFSIILYSIAKLCSFGVCCYYSYVVNTQVEEIVQILKDTSTIDLRVMATFEPHKTINIVDTQIAMKAQEVQQIQTNLLNNSTPSSNNTLGTVALLFIIVPLVFISSCIGGFGQ